MTTSTVERAQMAGAAKPGIRQRLIEWLSRPAVRRRVSGLPFGKLIARRYARRLFDISAGFVYSQILAALVELRIPELLSEGSGSATAADLARRTAVPERALARLLDGAESLGLVSRRPSGYSLTTLGAVLRENPGLTAMVRHHQLLYLDLEDPAALLREGGQGQRMKRFWGYAAGGDPRALGQEDVEGYCRLMTASAPLVIEQVLDSYPLGAHRHLLDVGGGEGAFLEAAGLQAPRLELTLFDLPAVAERAERRLAATPLGDRFRAVGGDFVADPLPTGADLLSFVRVLHDHDDATVAVLLAKARDALPRGGRVLIAEPLAETPGAEVVGAGYFGIYLLAMGQGHCRAFADYRALLEAAGFRRVRRWPTAIPLQAGVISAEA